MGRCPVGGGGAPTPGTGSKPRTHAGRPRARGMWTTAFARTHRRTRSVLALRALHRRAPGRGRWKIGLPRSGMPAARSAGGAAALRRRRQIHRTRPGLRHDQPARRMAAGRCGMRLARSSRTQLLLAVRPATSGETAATLRRRRRHRGETAFRFRLQALLGCNGDSFGRRDSLSLC